MKSTVTTLWGFPRNRFELAPDMDRMNAIIADMQASGSELAPSRHWTLGEEYTKTMESMLTAWVGAVGMLPLADPALIDTTSGDVTLLPRHRDYLQALDAHGLLPREMIRDLGAKHYRLTDLHSLIDLFLLTPYLENGVDEKIRVLEVGGGYGRLAELLQLYYPGRVQHVLIDAVPSSLMYAEVYLKAQLPNLKIVYAASESFADVADADIVILPSWRSHILPENAFDLCVNIESFQEMDKVHVDYYYDYFNSRTKTDGLIYLTNSRDYVYKGNWPLPANWEQFFKHRTPRSWTRNHPAELFRKRTRDMRASQQLHDHYYQLDLIAFDERAAAAAGIPQSEAVIAPAPIQNPSLLFRILQRLARRANWTLAAA